MKDWYKKIKEWLAAADTLHIWMSYFLSLIIAVGFNLIGTADPWVKIIVAPVIAFIIGVFVESFDGYFGTKDLDEKGILTNEFSLSDLLRDAVGCVLAMLTIAGLIL